MLRWDKRDAGTRVFRRETEAQSYARRTFDGAFFKGTFESKSARGAMLNRLLVYSIECSCIMVDVVTDVGAATREEGWTINTGTTNADQA